MSNSELALVAGAALAGLAFVMAIPQPIAETAASPMAPTQVLTDRTGVVLASDWKWPIAEDPEAAMTTESVEPQTTEDAPKRRCRRRRCR
jgi:hypothetical protein